MPAKLNQTVAKTNNQSSLQCYPEILKKLYFFFDIVAKTKEEIMKKTEKNLKWKKASILSHVQLAATSLCQKGSILLLL